MPHFWERIKKQSVLLTNSHKRSRIKRYLFPIVVIVAIIALKLFLQSLVGEYTAYHLLVLSIILSAWYGGFGPGLLATFLTVLVDATLFLPRGETYFGTYNVVSTTILMLGGIVVSFISEAKKQADFQKDEFIGFASHELKNPLASIQGYSQLLPKFAKGENSVKITRVAKTIEEQAKKATNLINELLDITNIESGRLPFYKEIFPMYELVKATVNDQKVVHSTHKIVFTCKTQKKVNADRLRLNQVLVNLITNAIKYSPNGKKILVSVERRKGEIIVKVQDFGKGIAKSNLNRIFDLYYRERSVSGGKVQGLGLGLYICSEIIKRHNGRLWAKSVEGKGSTFYLALPEA